MELKQGARPIMGLVHLFLKRDPLEPGEHKNPEPTFLHNIAHSSSTQRNIIFMIFLTYSLKQ